MAGLEKRMYDEIHDEIDHVLCWFKSQLTTCIPPVSFSLLVPSSSYCMNRQEDTVVCSVFWTLTGWDRTLPTNSMKWSSTQGHTARSKNKSSLQVHKSAWNITLCEMEAPQILSLSLSLSLCIIISSTDDYRPICLEIHVSAASDVNC